jgi:hypothetical protein
MLQRTTALVWGMTADGSSGALGVGGTTSWPSATTALSRVTFARSVVLSVPAEPTDVQILTSSPMGCPAFSVRAVPGAPPSRR